jgi:hypothetical protein
MSFNFFLISILFLSRILFNSAEVGLDIVVFVFEVACDCDDERPELPRSAVRYAESSDCNEYFLLKRSAASSFDPADTFDIGLVVMLLLGPTI